MPGAATGAPRGTTAGPATEEEEAPAEEAAKEDPVEATEPLADWTVASGGRLGFTARWNGEAVDGRFDRWRAAIRFSPDELAKSQIRVTVDLASADTGDRSEEHRSELQSLMRISYAVFCLKKKKNVHTPTYTY